MNNLKIKITGLLFSILLLGIVSGSAQYQLLLNFTSSNGYPDENNSLTLYGKTFYGVAQSGARGGGHLFSMDTNGSNYKDLFDFDSATGQYPSCSLILAGHKLYGNTSEGGGYGSGTLFSIDTNGGAYKILYNFYYANYASYGTPMGTLVLSESNLYGMTFFGDYIYSIDTNGNNYKEILDLSNISGLFPNGSLTLSLSGTKLFGMTSIGGLYDSGCVFSVDTSGNNGKDIFDFHDVAGAYPEGSLTLFGKKLYGMTRAGGTNGDGVIFSIDTNGNNYQVLLDFNNSNGSSPYGDLTFSNGKLYGMTNMGGINNQGVIFSIDTNGSNYKLMLKFDGFNGKSPRADLTPSGSVLYGMTQDGGSNDAGVFFRIDSNAVAGINPVKESSAGIVNVYPNPSNGNFTFNITPFQVTWQLPYKVEVYNMIGEKVYSNQFPVAIGTSSSLSIDLTHQPSGLFLYRVVANDGYLIGNGKISIAR